MSLAVNPLKACVLDMDTLLMLGVESLSDKLWYELRVEIAEDVAIGCPFMEVEGELVSVLGMAVG